MSILAILANGIHLHRREAAYEIVREDGRVYMTTNDKAHAENIASQVSGWRVRAKITR